MFKIASLPNCFHSGDTPALGEVALGSWLIVQKLRGISE